MVRPKELGADGSKGCSLHHLLHRVDTPTSKEWTRQAGAALFPWDLVIAPLPMHSGAHPGAEPSLLRESF